MIYFARHGHKAIGDYYNETLRIADDPLNEKGLEDAERIAAHFRDIPIAKIFASEYVRTQQTAAPAARMKRLPVTVDKRVNEINGGEFHRLSEEEARTAYPDFWREFVAHTHDLRFPGGESGADVIARQNLFLDDMRQEAEDVLVVSHDGFIRVLLCNILGLPVWMRYKFITTMGGITMVEYTGGEWRIHRFNQSI